MSFEQFLQLHLKQKTTEVESEAEIKDAFGVSVLSSWSSLLRSTWYFQIPSLASLWSVGEYFQIFSGGLRSRQSKRPGSWGPAPQGEIIFTSYDCEEGYGFEKYLLLRSKLPKCFIQISYWSSEAEAVSFNVRYPNSRNPIIVSGHWRRAHGWGAVGAAGGLSSSKGFLNKHFFIFLLEYLKLLQARFL